MGAETQGVLTKIINIDDIISYLEHWRGIDELKVDIKDDYWIFHFTYNSELEFNTDEELNNLNDDNYPIDNYDEKRELMISTGSEDEISDVLDSDKLKSCSFKEGFTYFSLGSWGNAPYIIGKILVNFEGGYICPKDNTGEWFQINKDNDELLHLLEVAYED